MTEKPQYAYLGGFPLHEVKRVIRRLESADIDYEMEIDDSGIKRMNPALVAAYGGTAGLGCQIRLFVAPRDADRARAILDSLFAV